MSESLSLDTSSAINALSALEKKFGGVLKSVKKFSGEYDAETFSAMKGTLTSLKEVAVQLNATSKAIDIASESVSKSFKRLGGAGGSLDGANTFDQLTKIIQKINNIPDIDATRVENITKSIRDINRSFQGINDTEFDASGLLQGMMSLDNVFRRITVVSDGSTSQSMGMVTFDKTKIELLKSISIAVNKLSIALYKFPKSNTIIENGKRVTLAVQQINNMFNKLSGAFNATSTVKDDGKLVIVETAESKTLAVRKVAEALNKLVGNLNKSMGSFSSKKLSQVSTTVDTIENAVKSLFGSFSKLFSGLNSVKTDKSGNEKSVVVELAESNTLAVRKVGDALSKLMASVGSSMKGFDAQKIGQIKTILSTLKSSVHGLFTAFADLFTGIEVTKVDASGNSVTRIVDAVDSKSLAIRKVGDSLNRFFKSLQEIKGNWDVSKATSVSKVITVLKDSIVAIFNACADLFSAVSVTVTKADGSSSNKIVQTANSQALAVAQVSNALSKLVSTLTSTSQSMNSAVLNSVSLYLQLLKSSVVNLFKDFSELFKAFSQVTTDANGNQSIKVVEYAESKTLAVKRICDALIKLSKASTSIAQINPSTLMANIATVRKAVTTLFTELGKLTQATNGGGGTPNAGAVSSAVEEFKKVAVALSRFTTSIGKLNSIDPKPFISSLTTVSVQIKRFISDLGGFTLLPVFSNFSKLTETIYRLAKSLGALSKQSDKAHSSMSKLSRTGMSFGKLGKVVMQFFTAFTGFSIVYSTARALQSTIASVSQLEMAMARVNTIARASKPVLAQWSTQVREMAVAYGKDRNDLAQALYDINSATITGSRAMFVLTASVRAARAGFTETGKVAELLSKAINSYGYAASDAGKLSDILFKTVERGINPMEELTQYMGRLLTVAKNAGVSFEEVNAAVATLTVNGFQTNIATTALNSSLLKLAQGNKQLNAVFQQFGYESAAAAIRVEGFGYALEKIKEASGGTTESLTKLGFNYRDIRAMSVLASGGLDEYIHNLEEMKKAAEEGSVTTKALDEVTNTLSFKWDVLKQSVADAFIAFQEWAGASPVLKDLLDGVVSITNSMRDLFANGEQVDSVLKQVCSTAKILLKVFVSYKVVFGLWAKVPILWGAIRTAITKTTGAFALFNRMQSVGIRAGLKGIPMLIFQVKALQRALFGLKLSITALKAAATFGLSLILDGIIAGVMWLIEKAQKVAKGLNNKVSGGTKSTSKSNGDDTADTRGSLANMSKGLEKSFTNLKMNKYLKTDEVNQAKDALASYIAEVKQLKVVLESKGSNATSAERDALAEAEKNVKRYQTALKSLIKQEQANRKETARYINLQHSLLNIEKNNVNAINKSVSAMTKYVVARAKANEARKALERGGINTSALDTNPADFTAQMKQLFEDGKISPELQKHVVTLSVTFAEMAQNIKGASTALVTLQNNLKYLAGISPKKDMLTGLINNANEVMGDSSVNKYFLKPTKGSDKFTKEAGMKAKLEWVKKNEAPYSKASDALKNYQTEKDAQQAYKNKKLAKLNFYDNQIKTMSANMSYNRRMAQYSLGKGKVDDFKAYNAKANDFMKQRSLIMQRRNNLKGSIDSLKMSTITSASLGDFVKNNPELAKKIDAMKSTDPEAIRKLLNEEWINQQNKYATDKGKKRYAELQRMFASGDPKQMAEATKAYKAEFGGDVKSFKSNILTGKDALRGAVNAVRRGGKIEDYTAKYKDAFVNEDEYKRWVEGLKKGAASMANLKLAFDNMAVDMKKFARNISDSLLSPEMRRTKKEQRWNNLSAKLNADMRSGMALSPEMVNEWKSLTQELSQMPTEFTVPTAVTSTKAVESGSEQAFDMVAKQVFADKNKPEERQVKLLQKSVAFGEKMANYLAKLADNTGKGIVPVYSGGR